jgi:mannose-6-phosphate isomerase
MFLPAGELHSYLEGVGIEIMANSDNVLRGGLTAKHVDVPELRRTLAFRAGEVERLHPRGAAIGERCYETPAEEFELAILEMRPDAPYAAPRERSVEILLCTAGSGRILADGVHSASRGDCFVVPSAARSYTVEGSLTLYRASPGVVSYSAAASSASPTA